MFKASSIQSNIVCTYVQNFLHSKQRSMNLHPRSHALSAIQKAMPNAYYILSVVWNLRPRLFTFKAMQFKTYAQDFSCSKQHSLNSYALLEITTLHNGMKLSILGIRSYGLAFGFSKRHCTNVDVFLTYKPMIIL